MAPTFVADPCRRERRQPYAGERAVLATMHGKDSVITPILLDSSGLIVETATGVDTNTLGTFTGETPRVGGIRDAAIAKARLGMAASRLQIGIASEGSYGPHPAVPFLAGGVELMVLVDDVRGSIIAEHLIEDAPNYGHATVTCRSELDSFLRRHRFPEHALIVKPNRPKLQHELIHKGIRDDQALAGAVAACAVASTDGKAFVQTDMRAHMNPARMASIARLARKFGARLASICPACGVPGFGQVDVETGLPCEWCDTPSSLVTHDIFGCTACAFRESRLRRDGRTHADPGDCARCNP